MYCKKCGNQLNENDKFCMKCGTPVQTSAPQIPNPTLTEENSNVIAKPRKSKAVPILIVVICLLLLAVAYPVYHTISEKFIPQENNVNVVHDELEFFGEVQEYNNELYFGHDSDVIYIYDGDEYISEDEGMVKAPPSNSYYSDGQEEVVFNENLWIIAESKNWISRMGMVGHCVHDGVIYTQESAFDDEGYGQIVGLQSYNLKTGEANEIFDGKCYILGIYNDELYFTDDDVNVYKWPLSGGEPEITSESKLRGVIDAGHQYVVYEGDLNVYSMENGELVYSRDAVWAVCNYNGDLYILKNTGEIDKLNLSSYEIDTVFDNSDGTTNEYVDFLGVTNNKIYLADEMHEKYVSIAADGSGAVTKIEKP